MRLQIFAVAVAIAGLCSAALANETYKFDRSGSTIGFTVHQYLGTTHGKFTRFDGRIDLAREHAEKSSVAARIDVRSIDTGIKKRDDHLRSPEFFNVAKFPEIVFMSTHVSAVKKTADGWELTLAGKLNLHGVEKPVSFPLRVRAAAGELRAQGEVSVLQTDHGITPIKVGGGSVKVKDKLKITFTIVATKAN